MRQSDIAVKRSTSAIKITVLTGLCTAASAALGFAFIAIPNVELITAAIFISGMILGPGRGIIAGGAAEFIFSALNPMGMAFPPLMIAQVGSMMIAGYAGGALVKHLVKSEGWARVVLFGAVGLIITINFDFWTTLSFPIASGFNREQTMMTIKMGIPFAIPHLLGNTAIFAFLVGPAYNRLRRLVNPGRVGIAAIIMIIMIPVSLKAESPTDSLTAQDWEITYYQDMADVIMLLPGFYHYDLAVPGQPEYLRYFRGIPIVVMEGVPMNSVYSGDFDHSMFSPGMMNSISFFNSYNDGIMNAGGVIEFRPELTEPDKPYSRINYRDGYYGFGNADFVFAQRTAEKSGFQAGGDIAEFNGRFSNSGFSSQQFRGCLYYNRNDGWKLKGNFLSNHNKAEITHTYDRRLFNRTDIFLTADKSDSLKTDKITAHFYSWEDDYLYIPDVIEKAGRIKLLRRMFWKGFSLEPSIFLNWYDMETGNGFKENQGEGTGAISMEKQYMESAKVFCSLSGGYGRDFLVNGSAGVEFEAWKHFTMGMTGCHSEKSAAAMYRIPIQDSQDFFLPGSLINMPGTGFAIAPNGDLQPSKQNSMKVYGKFEKNNWTFKPSLYALNNADPIVFSVTDPNLVEWKNGGDYADYGFSGELSYNRELGFAGELAVNHYFQDNPEDYQPNNWSYLALHYRNSAFEDNLLYTIEIHGKYYGERDGMMNTSSSPLPGTDIWGMRFIFNIKDFTIFWGNENIFSKEYELVPGYYMMHREEVWGVKWIFWD